MHNIDLTKYQEFVNELASKPSKDLTTFMNRCDQLDGHKTIDINVPLLLAGALGLASETGEFCEIPKKIFLQGKELSEENLFHMKRELGDVIWYWMAACTALRLDPNEVIAENVKKLESRYPGGSFDAFYSENRKAGDL
jgi:NTP pyrophosphatase (non-canonical NTP hydrolase)